MPIISTNIFAAGTALPATSADPFYVITDTATIVSMATNALEFQEEVTTYTFRVFVSGSLIGAYGSIGMADNFGTVTIEEGGFVGGTIAKYYSKPGAVDILNFGEIAARSYDAISLGADADIVSNYGTIRANFVGGKIDAAVVTWGGSDIITNFGTIENQLGFAIRADSGDTNNPVTPGSDRLINWGTIIGHVSLDGGNDTLRNGGQVVGDADLGNGNDLFRGWDGTVDGSIHGRGGNDTIAGGISDDAIFGDNGIDVLKGGQGDDTLNGGPGRDLMRGGAGLDTFDFNKTSDSAVGAQRDHILDFSKADDVIDVAGIDAKTGVGGNQAFHFIGAMAFSGTKGELRAINVGADSKVLGDVNGDGHADFSFLVENINNLHAADFIL